MKLHRKLKHNEKVCHAHNLGSHVQGPGHDQGSEVKSSFCNNLKPTEANFFKLYKKLNHNKTYVTHNIYIPKCQGHNLGSGANYVTAITVKSTKANFINISRQIRHHERVCRSQDTGSHTQGQVNNQKSNVKLLIMSL